MIDFIPLEYYSTIHYHIILLIVLFTLLHALALKGNENIVYNYNRIMALLLLLYLMIYMGLRPVSGKYFVDMATYANVYQRIKAGYHLTDLSDFGFGYFMTFCSYFLSEKGFFMACTLLYVTPLYIASRRFSKNYYFFAFLMFVASFSFWAYGVNGIRNGIATSLLILAFSYHDRKAIMIILMLLSVSFHKSMILPIMAFIITYFVKNTSLYFILWMVAIGLSLLMGSFWESFFANLGFDDDRLAGYLIKTANREKFSSTGFRFDFLIYSALPVIAGYYYVVKRNFTDSFYNKLLQTYLLANSFWIMVIRANFSNRFAYLSWFMMAIIICYPLLHQAMWKKQFSKLGLIILLYFSFTYIMHLIYQFKS
ncbi:EpsG family protein [Abyssalbus ytuae]|uniref:EpsG family protein n=1 Tax=Abyssalbus ytuae TaxID=2926907 RepID=A0A9E6ZXP3_9FLAO|nr:EpsG family protein [Abyssalbus ytuae]UOB17077.1 EpsG family protein [Abyssalbus ytuae]